MTDYNMSKSSEAVKAKKVAEGQDEALKRQIKQKREAATVVGKAKSAAKFVGDKFSALKKAALDRARIDIKKYDAEAAFRSKTQKERTYRDIKKYDAEKK